MENPKYDKCACLVKAIPHSYTGRRSMAQALVNTKLTVSVGCAATQYTPNVSSN